MTATETEEDSPKRWTASTIYLDMWCDPDQDPRETGDQPTDERSNLLEYLRSYRLTLEMKCQGLDPEQLARRSVPPSTMSLLGLIRHMADVERSWFRRVLAGKDVPRLYRTDDDREADWTGAVPDASIVEEAWNNWREEIRFANWFIEDHPDLSMKAPFGDRGQIQLRSVLVHMIEEYARHCGHADLLRERIDGRVGQ